MKHLFKLLLTLFLLSNNTNTYAWGFYGHKTINRNAIFTLPSALMAFYKQHIDYITEHAVDADKRRYTLEEEASRHYIDLDRYGSKPFEAIPQSYYAAKDKFGEDSLKKHGIVPWHITLMLAQLTQAFREKNIKNILYYSVNLGHYVADAHVPLHTTQNYNGQLTGQEGIHGLWESRVPELLGKDYDLLVGQSIFIKHPQQFVWHIIAESNAAVDSVLSLERTLNKQFPSDEKYAYEQRGRGNTKVYSFEYASNYDLLQNGMAERRMRQAILALGSLWYTAWVNAGSPNLKALNDKPVEYISDSLQSKKPVNTIPHED